MSPYKRLILISSLMAIPYHVHAQTAPRKYKCVDALNPNLNLTDLTGSFPGDPRISMNFKLEMAGLYQTVENTYGPLSAKQQLIGLNWVKAKADGLRVAKSLENSNEQYYAFADFLMGFNDAHVSVELPSDAVLHSSIQGRSAEGRAFVDTVLSDFPADQRRPVEGDEILKINGQSPQEYQGRFAAWNATSNSQSSFLMFLKGMANLKESRGVPVSKMTDTSVSYQIQSKATGEIYDVTIPLVKTGGVGLIGRSLKKDSPDPQTVVGQIESVREKNTSPGFKNLAPASYGIIEKFHRLFKAEVSVEKEKSGSQLKQLGEQAPFFQLPKNFQRIMLPESLRRPEFADLISDENLFAGSFIKDGHRYGFLRIASYSPKSMAGSAVAMRFFLQALGKEGLNVEHLFIDQTQNPGGYVTLTDLYIKMLNGGEYDLSKHMRYAVKPTQRFMRNYLEAIHEITQNPDNLLKPEEVKYFVDALRKEYDKMDAAFENKLPLSEPISMVVTSQFAERSIDATLQTKNPIQGPDGKVYVVTPAMMLQHELKFDVSKSPGFPKEIPKTFLIDEGDFSGGDATPAMFQDYGLGNLVGNGTGGAGGTVEVFEHRGLLELKYHLTTSLMIRADGQLIENVRVWPKKEDLFPLRAKDVQDRYANYFMDLVERELSRRPKSNRPPIRENPYNNNFYNTILINGKVVQ